MGKRPKYPGKTHNRQLFTDCSLTEHPQYTSSRFLWHTFGYYWACGKLKIAVGGLYSCITADSAIGHGNNDYSAPRNNSYCDPHNNSYCDPRNNGYCDPHNNGYCGIRKRDRLFW